MNQEGHLAELVGLAHDRSASGRARLASQVSDFFDQDLCPAEADIAAAIITKLLDQLEVTARRVLAEKLAPNPRLDRRVALVLAQDEISVAEPILIQSDALTEADLIALLADASALRGRYIARRSSISTLLADALVDTHDSETILALVMNDGADLSNSAMARLIAIAEREERLHEPLLQRQEMTAAFACRLYLWVSEELRDRIGRDYHLSARQLDEAVDRSINEFVQSNLTSAQVTPAMQRWADRLFDSGRLTAALMTQVLRQSQYALFIAMWSRLTGVDTYTARQMLEPEGARHLSVAARAVGISKPEFASIFLLSRGIRRDDQAVDPNELRRTLETFERLSPLDAQRLLTGWQIHDGSAKQRQAVRA